jgi:hypothetical protein
MTTSWLFPTQSGATALFMSAHNDHLEVARLLLESKADINAEGQVQPLFQPQTAAHAGELIPH